MTEAHTEIRVDGAAALTHGETLRFCYEADGRVVECFVLRYEDGPVDTMLAYRNWCPHIGTDLDMGSGRFYSRSVGRIYCHTHGAQFQAVTGLCDFGPCVGLHLEQYPVRVDGSDVWVTVPGTAPAESGM